MSFSESEYTNSFQLPDATSGNNSFAVEGEVPPKAYRMISAFFAVFLLGALTALASLVGFYSLTDHSSPNVVVQKCSNKGIYEPDTLMCECFPCISGDNCEIVMANETACIVDARYGQTYMFEEFWMNYTRDIDTSGQGFMTDLTYRVPYDMGGPLDPDGTNLTSFDQLLNQAIRSLHAKWQNAVTDNYYIVYGYGATQVIAAAMFAQASKKNRSLAVFEQVPYYPGHSTLLVPTSNASMIKSPYPITSSIFNPSILTWSTSRDLNPESVLEMVTIPANPNGMISTPVYPYPASRVYDLTYYWPHLTNNSNKTYQEDIMVFSLSKLTGHASTRFGWALVKDRDVATCMLDYIFRQNLWVSSSARRRALVLFNTMYSSGDYFMSSISTTMNSRWDRILELLNGNQNRFTLVGAPYTAYLYLQMNYEKEQSADASNALFNAVGILGQPGSCFGDLNGTYRISLTLHSHMFEYLITRLKLLMYSYHPWASRV